MFSFLLKILFFVIYYPFIKGNHDYYKIITNFEKKFPPKDKLPKIIEEKDFPRWFPETFKYISVYNTSTLDSKLSQQEFDYFIKELQDFKCFRTTIFRKKIYKHKNSLINRFKSIDLNKMKGDVQKSLDFQMMYMNLQKSIIPYLFSTYTIVYIKNKLKNITYENIVMNIILPLVMIVYLLFVFFK
jgi:hypothetical protein